MTRPFTFPDGRRAAISLTYDDGLAVHHEEVAPALEAHGIRATFYAQINSDLVDNPHAWRRMAGAGHELGNHTVFHPCRKHGDGNCEWIDEGRDLRRYTIDRWQREVGLANRVLSLIDGRTIRSFGNTCHNTTVGPEDNPQSIEPHALHFFSAARGPRNDQVINPEACSLPSLGCFRADGRSFDEMRLEIDLTIAQGGWIIYCAHGVGRDHNLVWDAEEHALTLDYLHARQHDIWAAPVTDVAERIQAWRDLH